MNRFKHHELCNGLREVQHIFLVGSGKGGVGKSTVSVNIAAALLRRGNRVGILDADIYGPSIPFLLGTHDMPIMVENGSIIPVQVFGMQMISIGSLMPRKQAINLRGKAVLGTIQKFLRQVDWGRLDFLIVDLPSGTGDIQITIAKESKPNGAVIITTPHPLVREDVHRCISMFKQQDVCITGLVENMVSWTCGKCGHVESFYAGKTDRWCDVETIAVLPMDRSLWESSINGVPFVLNEIGSDLGRTFNRIAALLEFNSKQQREISELKKTTGP